MPTVTDRTRMELKRLWGMGYEDVRLLLLLSKEAPRRERSLLGGKSVARREAYQFALDRLMRDKLVEKRLAGSDGVAFAYQLTAAGHERVAEFTFRKEAQK